MNSPHFSSLYFFRRGPTSESQATAHKSQSDTRAVGCLQKTQLDMNASSVLYF